MTNTRASEDLFSEWPWKSLERSGKLLTGVRQTLEVSWELLGKLFWEARVPLGPVWAPLKALLGRFAILEAIGQGSRAP
eukprot:6922718-Pyramimonas_sp.AAC.1